MVVEVLTTNATAMSICIVSPADDARIRDIVWKEVAKPVNAICSRPGLVSVSIQPMNDDDTVEGQVTRCSARRSSILNDRAVPVCHHLETLWACLKQRLCCL
jgi:hypothetical protein